MNRGLPGAMRAILARDLALAVRHRGELLHPVLFFVVVVSLFPLAVSPGAEVLARIGPGVLWVAALLATLTSLDGLFRSDYEDGSADLMLLSPHPLYALVAAKTLAHWLITGLPLVIVSPLLAELLALPDDALGILVVTLALGTPTLSLVGAIGVALTVGLARGGVLLSVLVLPLYVPVLVFGAHAVSSAARGLPVLGQIYVLGALLALAAALAPVAAAAALRISAE